MLLAAAGCVGVDMLFMQARVDLEMLHTKLVALHFLNMRNGTQADLDDLLHHTRMFRPRKASKHVSH